MVARVAWVAMLAAAWPILTVSACNNAAKPDDNLVDACCQQSGAIDVVYVDSGKRYDHVNDLVYDGGVNGTDDTSCGASWSAPCKSIKWAFANRIKWGAADAKVLLASGGYFAGERNRDLRAQAGASTGGVTAMSGAKDSAYSALCTLIGPQRIEGNSTTNRPMVDLEFMDRFLTFSGWVDPSFSVSHCWSGTPSRCGWEGDSGQLTLKNIAFMRGHAKNEDISCSGSNGGTTYCPGNAARNWANTASYANGGTLIPTVCLNGHPQLASQVPDWFTCPCNVSDPAQFDSVTLKCKAAGTPTKVGFGGVLQLWGGYTGDVVYDIINCDFGKSQALMGGAIGWAGGTLNLKGDPVPFGSHAQGPIAFPIGSNKWIQSTGHQADEPFMGSYCNFYMNNAWGNAVDKGAGGAIYHMPVFELGVGRNPKMNIEGCTFYRNTAFNPVSNSYGKGGAIGGLWTGYLGADWASWIYKVSAAQMPVTNELPVFNFTKVAFYENKAYEGSGFYQAPNRGILFGFKGATTKALGQNTSLKEYWRQYPATVYMNQVYAARQGWSDGKAMKGAPKSDQQYGATKFERTLPNNVCKPAVNTSMPATCFSLQGQLVQGDASSSTTMPLGYKLNASGPYFCVGAQCKCGEQTLTQLACASGNQGAFETHPDPSLRWPLMGMLDGGPIADTDAVLTPYETYACKNYDNYGYAVPGCGCNAACGTCCGTFPTWDSVVAAGGAGAGTCVNPACYTSGCDDELYTPGSKYVLFSKSVTQGNEYFANCRSMGKYTPMEPRFESNIDGIVNWHGGFWYGFGANNWTYVIKDSIFTMNAVAGDGGAFYLTDRNQMLTGTFRFERNKFIRNRARAGGAIKFAGLSTPTAQPDQYIDAPQTTKLELIDCEFVANIARWKGAAVAAFLVNWHSSVVPTWKNTTAQVPPPICPTEEPAACSPVTMGTYGVLTIPYGSKVNVEMSSSAPVSSASQLSSASKSVAAWNVAGKRGGVFALEFYAGSERPIYNCTWDLRVSDTYIANNGVRYQSFPDSATAQSDTKQMSGKGGVVSIWPDVRKKNTYCQECGPDVESGAKGCLASSNGRPTQAPFDACAYQDYIIPASTTLDNSLAAYKDVAFLYRFMEDTPVIRFTRCAIDSNVARDAGGVIWARTVLRDAPNITFDSCTMANNTAFLAGSLIDYQYQPDPFGTYQSRDAIRTGQDVWIGQLHIKDSNVTGLTQGFYAAINVQASLRLLIEGSTITKTVSTIYTNTTHWCGQPVEATLPGSYLYNQQGQAVAFAPGVSKHKARTYPNGRVFCCPDGYWKSTNGANLGMAWASGATWTCPLAYDCSSGTCINGNIGMFTTTDEYYMLTQAMTGDGGQRYLGSQTCTQGGLLYAAGDKVVQVIVNIKGSTIQQQSACNGGFFCQGATTAIQKACTTTSNNCSGSYPVGGQGASSIPGCPSVATNYRCLGTTTVGGAVHTMKVTLAFTLDDSILDDSLALPQDPSNSVLGGHFKLWSASVIARNSEFNRGFAQDGGGGFAVTTSFGESQLVAAGSNFNENGCTTYGCVVELWLGSSFKCYGCGFKGNKLMGGDGGTLFYQWQTSSIELYDGTIEENFSARHTAGMWLKGESSATLQNMTVKNNYASWYAGTIFAQYTSKVYLTDVTFTNNRALGYDGRGGGVMLLMDNSQAEVTNCKFKGNRAYHDGGAIQVRGGPRLQIASSTFEENSAGEDGGAMFVEHDLGSYWLGSEPKDLLKNEPIFPLSNVTISDTSFVGNVAGLNGGAFATQNAFTYMDNCSGTRNYADVAGGFAAILHANGSIWMRGQTGGTVLSNNIGKQAGGAFYSRGIQEGDPARMRNATRYPRGPLRKCDCTSEAAPVCAGGYPASLAVSPILGTSASICNHTRLKSNIYCTNSSLASCNFTSVNYCDAIRNKDGDLNLPPIGDKSCDDPMNNFYSWDRDPQDSLGNASRACPAHTPSDGTKCPGGALKLQKMALYENAADLWGGAFAFDRVPLTAMINETTVQRNYAGSGSVAALLYNTTADLLEALDIQASSRRSASSAAAAAVQNRIFIGDKLNNGSADLPLTQDNMAYYHSVPAAMSLSTPGVSNKAQGFIPGVAYDNVYGNHGEDMNALKFSTFDALQQPVYIANSTFCLLKADVSPSSTELYGHKAPCALAQDSALNNPDCIRAPTLAGVLDSTTAQGSNKFKAIEFRSYFDAALNLRVQCAHRMDYQSIPWEMRKFGDISANPVVAYGQILARDCPKGWQPEAALTQALYSQKMFVKACSPCPAGFFSPAINAKCQQCPAGSSSLKGSVGIGGCFCPDGKFIREWQYTGVDPSNTGEYGEDGMACTDMKKTCKKGPIVGSGFNGANCNLAKPWTSTGPNRYPLAKKNAWTGICDGTNCRPLPVTDWGPNTMINKCPYKNACPGEYNKDMSIIAATSLYR